MVFLDDFLSPRRFTRWRASSRRSWRALAAFAGPAFVASVAYVDPGNFATNIESGARFGYRLLWVVAFANLVAMLFQALSAKLGIVAGESLAGLCRARLPRPLSLAMWVVSEAAAMATDLAEFLGASVGLALLAGLPLVLGTLLVGVVTWIVLAMESAGFRAVERFVTALIATIGLCYLIETALVRPDWPQVAYHIVVPWLGGYDSVMLAAGIIGATVMPHAIYLHSGLARDRHRNRHGGPTPHLVRASHLDVVVALGLAGLVNLAMVYVAADVFEPNGGGAVVGIESAYETLRPLFGGMAAGIFLVALLASGLSSSVVGTLAGQGIMADFLGWRVPLWVRRLVTMLPAVAIAAWGVDATTALVLSQVVLSLVLPVPMAALVFFTSRKSVMGDEANGWPTTIVAAAATLLVLALNLVLVLGTFGIELPL